jgi:hypothetical protein
MSVCRKDKATSRPRRSGTEDCTEGEEGKVMAREDKGKTQLAFLVLIIFALVVGISMLLYSGHGGPHPLNAPSASPDGKRPL